MKLSGGVQESLLALLCFDDTPGGGKFVRGLVDNESYDAFYRDVADAACDYIERYGKVPGEHTLDLVQALCKKRPDAEDMYTRLFESIELTKEGVNREYVLSQATAFVRMQSIRSGVTDIMDCLERDDEEALEDADRILEVIRTRQVELFEPGTFLGDRKALRFLDSTHDAMVTGIENIDKYGLGPERKKLHLFMAPMKRGKSWWMIQLAKMGLLHKMKVLIITLEMPEEDYAARMFQSIFSLTKRKAEAAYYEFVPSQPGGAPLNFAETILTDRPSLEDHNIYEYLAKKQDRMLSRRPPLLIKEFPSGRLSMKQLEAYICGLEATGFIPDILLLDYVDLMDWRSMDRDKRVGIGELYIGLRGLAGERNLRVATCTQSNRLGAQAKVLDETHLAEDWSKGATCDTLLAHSQTKAERLLNLARIGVVAARGDRSGFQFLISQCYALGQFCIDEHPMEKGYFEEVKHHASQFSDDVDDDDDEGGGYRR